VSGIQGSQQVNHLSPTDLADNDPVRPHAKGLSNQIPQRHLARTLDVRRPRLESHDVWVGGCELACVFDEQHPVGRVDEREQCGQQRRLPGSGPPGDEKRGARGHQPPQKLLPVSWQRACGDQLGQREHPPARHAQ